MRSWAGGLIIRFDRLCSGRQAVGDVAIGQPRSPPPEAPSPVIGDAVVLRHSVSFEAAQDPTLTSDSLFADPPACWESRRLRRGAPSPPCGGSLGPGGGGPDAAQFAAGQATGFEDAARLGWSDRCYSGVGSSSMKQKRTPPVARPASLSLTSVSTLAQPLLELDAELGRRDQGAQIKTDQAIPLS